MVWFFDRCVAALLCFKPALGRSRINESMRSQQGLLEVPTSDAQPSFGVYEGRLTWH